MVLKVVRKKITLLEHIYIRQTNLVDFSLHIYHHWYSRVWYLHISSLLLLLILFHRFQYNLNFHLILFLLLPILFRLLSFWIFLYGKLSKDHYLFAKFLVQVKLLNSGLKELQNEKHLMLIFLLNKALVGKIYVV